MLAHLVGNLLYLYRYRLPWSLALGAPAFALAVGLIALAHSGGLSVVLVYPAVALLAYVVAIVGLADLPPLPFFGRGDYSYGIYIFGFPIQQTVTQFLPDHRNGWVNFVIALPVTLLFAVASWHWVEKPALGCASASCVRPNRGRRALRLGGVREIGSRRDCSSPTACSSRRPRTSSRSRT